MGGADVKSSVTKLQTNGSEKDHSNLQTEAFSRNLNTNLTGEHSTLKTKSNRLKSAAISSNYSAHNMKLRIGTQPVANFIQDMSD